ncbi:MAG: glycosyltransferase family protein [Candidatus Chisholmbacteria bacterium]|nr:glycosyltransferase family protein [Candidatus Chisholmbacteria bacterium]
MTKNNVVAIIQARMGSTRFPGKVLKLILGKPMLERMLERVQRAKLIDQVVVATTTNIQDDSITRLTDSLNISSFRGSEPNVLNRFYQAAKKFKATVVVRLTADCPVIDPELIDKTIKLFHRGKYDYVSTRTLTENYPRGMDVEVMTFRSLSSANRYASSAFQREHVTPYIYSKPQKFSLKAVPRSHPHFNTSIRLTVDQPADLKLIRLIFKHFYPANSHFDYTDIFNLFKRHPRLSHINRHVVQASAS